MAQGFGMCDKHEFIFEFDKAYNAQLIEKFEASPLHELTQEIAPAAKGVYGLYWKGDLAYAGKAMQNTTLRRRLSEHWRKIRDRQSIDVSEVSCRFLMMENDWFVRAAEDALIEHYAPAWNNTGFGRHVPGRGRPGIRPSQWETAFPLKD
jgi:hypothetical protein